MDKRVGAVLILLWSVARVYFWSRAGKRQVIASDMPFRRRLLLVLVSGALIPVYLYYFTPLLERFDLPAAAWLVLVGNAGIAAAVALFVWSHLVLGSAWTVAVDIAEGQHLVTSGPFRRVRHPMYSSLLLLAISLVPATHNPVASMPFLVAIVAMYLDRVGDEERLLARTFGDDYVAYAQRTGRIVPRLRRHPS